MKKILYGLITIFLIIGVFYFKKKDNTNKEELIKKEKIFHFSEKDAYEWEINYNNLKIICEKINDEWTVGYPKKIKVEQNAVIANIKNFNTAEYLSIVANNTNNLKKWGLEGTVNSYHLKIKNDKENIEHVLYEGKETGLDPNGYYVRYSLSSNVFHVEEWLIKALQKSLAELRFKDFVFMDPEKIEYLKINNINIRKDGYFWKIDELSKKYVDEKKVDKIVQHISFMKIEKVYEKNQLKGELKKVMTVEISGNGKDGLKREVFFDMYVSKSNVYCHEYNADLYYKVPDYFNTNINLDKSFYLR